MSDTMRHICWVLLLLSIVLPLALRALKWVWIKVSAWHRFEPDFVRSFKTFFFGSLRDNVNYVPAWENMGIVLTCGLTIVLCDSIARQLRKLLPGMARVPDIVVKSLGVFGLVATIVGFVWFLRQNRPGRKVGRHEMMRDNRGWSIPFATLMVAVIFIIVSVVILLVRC